MPFPPTGSSGSYDLGNWSMRLHFVNRALRILQLHSDVHGFLSISSSTKLLQQNLPELSSTQVTEVNEALFRLGLRDTKPGGADHVIRMDVTRVTDMQLRAGIRIPHEKEKVTKDTIEYVQLAFQALRENAEAVEHNHLKLGIVRQHIAVIEELCGEHAGEVIMRLKALALYRMQTIGDDFVCFVNLTDPADIDERQIRAGIPLFEWPTTLGELVPPSMLVGNMSAEQIIAALTQSCEQSETEVRRLRAALEQRNKELEQVAEAYEQLEGEHGRLREARDNLAKENELLAAKIKELEEQPIEAALDPGLASRVQNILRRRPGQEG